MNYCDPTTGLTNSTILNQTCTSISCLSCNSSMFVSPEGICVASCPLGFFGLNGRCQPCNTGTWVGLTECFADDLGKIIPLACDK